eukprot:CAMPEP_0176424988 /NCGR_PEP_ID=MMETSP0127-20121128/11148_1 /TAXON_ID=938130 /ORGANISM="Platyophrya macrostoma, Strain WH" /LENGTH=269 /DNA_ID=CAMNT_0017806117 /DNA_START=29 /DNA_END=838 /DNA_ORIENTATION=+
MAAASNLKAELQSLETLVAQQNPKPSAVDPLVKELQVKIAMLDLEDNGLNQQQIVELSRYFEEILLFYYVKTKNYEEIEGTFSRLKSFYYDFGPVSNKETKDQLLSIYLLYLLTFNKFGEFFLTLERIPQEEQQNSKYIKFVVSIESQLSMGTYKEILQAKKNSPLHYFDAFLDRIFETVRFEVSRNAEKAYDHVLLNDAVQLFYLNDKSELDAFIKKEAEHGRENGIEWTVAGDRILFKELAADKHAIDAEKGISKLLTYAEELEKII